MYIGNHLSASKGYAAMGRMAVKLGANTFAFFTRNPRGGAAKAIDPADVEKLLELMREQQFPGVYSIRHRSSAIISLENLRISSFAAHRFIV